jgi:hypothetical protein
MWQILRWMEGIVTLRMITGELNVHDSAPHIIFQPTTTICVSADLWLLDFELDISIHSRYIAEIQDAAVLLQEKIKIYHMAVDDFTPEVDTPSDPYK